LIYLKQNKKDTLNRLKKVKISTPPSGEMEIKRKYPDIESMVRYFGGVHIGSPALWIT
jgi:hypothetical protein